MALYIMHRIPDCIADIAGPISPVDATISADKGNTTAAANAICQPLLLLPTDGLAIEVTA